MKPFSRRTQTMIESRHTVVHFSGDDSYPILDAIPDRPAVLFQEGSATQAWDQPRVAIVGTRSATPPGLADAFTLAQILAQAGVTVVSGMARGIDGAAHRGALAGGGITVGVIATGLDIEFPASHRRLYKEVREHGLIVGENEFGTPPEPWRFPVRNRIIAALADVVVVIEATLKGGARITADYALDYDRVVFAMPGSRRNAAAAGCNQLLADGAHPLLEPSDVFIALDMGQRASWNPPKANLSREAKTVFQKLGGEPATLDELEEQTKLSPTQLAVAANELEIAGKLRRARGLVWPL